MSEESKTVGGPVTPEQVDAAKARTREISVWEGVSWSVMWGFGESYISPFAIALQASNTAMALLGTLPIIIGAFAQMIGASITERFSMRLPLSIRCVTVHSASYIPLFVLPLIFPSIAAWCVVAVFTFMIAANGISQPAWTGMMGDVVPEETRGKYFARRARYSLLAMILSISVAGLIMWQVKLHDHLWFGFGLLFGVALLARGFCIVLLKKHYDPPFKARDDTYFSFYDFIRRAPKSNFAKFSFTIGLLNGCTMVGAPFFGVYMLRDLHWSYLQFTSIVIVAMLSQALVFPWWGKIADRHGNRIVVSTTSLLLPIAPFIWAFVTDYYVLLATQVIGGMVWAGFGLATGNFIYDAVTPQKRPRVTSYFNVVNGLFCILGGAVVGAFLSEHLPSSYHFCGMSIVFLSSLPAVFLVSSLARFILAAALNSSFKEVRKMEPITTGALLWRITTCEPIIGQLTEILHLVWAPLRKERVAKPEDEK